MRTLLKTCSVIGLLGAMAVTSAVSMAGKNHYRWIDERGNPVHSDRPPPAGIDYEVITTGSSLTRQVDADEGAVPAEIEPRVGNEFEQVRNPAPAVKKNPEYCQRARDNLQTLENSARVRLRNDEGEYRYLTEEEIDVEKQKARDTMAMHCE